MLLDRPYFLKNKEWYIEEDDAHLPSCLRKNKRQYRLTDKAPQKAIDSYNKYYELLEHGDIIW